MNPLWLIVAFVVGWLGCWYLGRHVLRIVFKKRDGYMPDVIAGMHHESLLKLRDVIERELAKRRGDS